MNVSKNGKLHKLLLEIFKTKGLEEENVGEITINHGSIPGDQSLFVSDIKKYVPWIKNPDAGKGVWFKEPNFIQGYNYSINTSELLEYIIENKL